MRFIRGHTIVHLLSPVGTSSDSLHIFMRLSERPFWGLVGKDASPPIKFTPALWRCWHLLIWFVLYKVYFNTLDICLQWLLSCVQCGQSIKVPTLLLRVLWLLNVSDVFGGGSKVVREFSNCFHASWLFFVQSLRGSPLLSPVVWAYGRFSEGTSVGSCLSPSSLRR